MPEGNHNQDIGDDAEDWVASLIKTISSQSLGTRWKILQIYPDIGEDRLIRIYKNGKSLPFHFYIQIKGIENLKKHLINDGKIISFPLKTSHINDWMHFPVPVIIMICDMSISTKIVYWEVVQDCLDEYTDDKRTQEEFNVHIPIENVVNENGLKIIANRTKKMFAASKQKDRDMNEVLDIVQKYQSLLKIHPPQDNLITWETEKTVGIRIYGEMYEKLVDNKLIGKIMQDEGLSLEDYLQIRMYKFIQLLEKMRQEGCDTIAVVDSRGNIERFYRPFDDTNFLGNSPLEDFYEPLENFDHI